MELTNYHSDFEKKKFRWNVELHYSQGKKKAAVYNFEITKDMIEAKFRNLIEQYIKSMEGYIYSFDKFQQTYCKTTAQRISRGELGPYELLDSVREFIDQLMVPEERTVMKTVDKQPTELPNAIVVGYYILQQIVKRMEEKTNGCDNKKEKTH